MKLAKLVNLLFPQWNNKQKGELHQKLSTQTYVFTGMVDIFTLDEALQEEYPEYGAEGFSMEQFIEHLVGKEKALEVKELLNI